MNLQELEARSPAKHYTKVLEQYFGRKVSLRNLSENDTKRLLSRVRNLIAERRADPSIHYSERDPKFIQLMMVEQALKYRLKENTQYAPSGATNNAGAMTQPAGGSTTTPTPAEKQKVKSQQLQAAQKIKDPKLQQTMKKSISGQTLSKDEQQSMAGAMMGSPIQNESIDKKESEKKIEAYGVRGFNSKQWRKVFKNQAAFEKWLDANEGDVEVQGTRDVLDENWNRHWRIQISESEIQQAQVILAAQDLVDQVQKMIEQCTSVQFKDLPALVNQVKNEVGYDKAVQFNQDSGTAFSTLVQSMQTAKLQLEAAVGIITGQQSSIPSVGSPNDTGMTPPPSPDEDMDFDMDMDFDEPEMGGEETTLGRARAK
jgi:hypothetical protein